MTSNQKIALVCGLVAGGVGVAVIAVLLGTYVGQFLGGSGFSGGERDPLTRQEVEEELKNLPMPATVFYERVRSKQTYFADYGADPGPGIDQRAPWARSSLSHADRDGKLWLVPGKTVDDVVRRDWVISWDGWSGSGTHTRVNHTGGWALLLDENDVIIGYIDQSTDAQRGLK